MLSNLLIYRWTILQLCYIGGAVAAWQWGLWHLLYRLDSSGIVVAIGVFFCLAWGDIARHIVRVCLQLNAAKRNGSAEAASHVDADKAATKIAYLAEYPVVCVELGLFGTIVGVAMAMYMPDWGAVKSVNDLAMVIGPLLTGMGTAFMTTLAGMIAARLLQNNIVVLTTAHTTLWADRVRAGLQLCT